MELSPDQGAHTWPALPTNGEDRGERKPLGVPYEEGEERSFPLLPPLVSSLLMLLISLRWSTAIGCVRTLPGLSNSELLHKTQVSGGVLHERLSSSHSLTVICVTKNNPCEVRVETVQLT